MSGTMAHRLFSLSRLRERVGVRVSGKQVHSDAQTLTPALSRNRERERGDFP